MSISHFFKKTGLLLLLGVSLSLIGACANMNNKSLQGEVFYLERMALPENAEVYVFLQDVSLADAPAPILAQTVINANGKQVPIPFTLTYDGSVIKANHTYSIRANIKAGDRLMFTTTEHLGLKLDGSDLQPVKVRVERVRR